MSREEAFGFLLTLNSWVLQGMVVLVLLFLVVERLPALALPARGRNRTETPRLSDIFAFFFVLGVLTSFGLASIKNQTSSDSALFMLGVAALFRVGNAWLGTQRPIRSTNR